MQNLQPLCASVALLLFSLAGICQPVKNYKEEVQLLKKTILQHHVSPRKINDQFSEWIFENFLDELDPNRLYFTEEDLKVLNPYRFKLDDEINGTSWAFLPLTIQTYKKCLMRTETITEQLFKKSMAFNIKEMYLEDTVWARNEAELRDRWRLALKHEVISKLQEMRSAVAVEDNKFLEKAEPEARQRVKARITRSIKRISNHAAGFENYISDLYLQSIALSFDPHSAYLSATAMENFLSSLSSEGYYFGIMLDENENGDIVIEQLTPGGPAWKSGDLNSGDVIRQLKWEGKEPMDLSGVGMEEINNLLLETNHASLELTVVKPGGEPETLVLQKEKMHADENIVKSFILKGERKIGYISLPGFYTNWGKAGGSQCANDVAKEIIKLKKEGIEGLVFDLRFNGGGSLQEAVAMAGIFIDAGPIGVIKNKSGEATSIKDINRGTVYDGPLVLMVNGMSASASEFLAAALQDYQRAIIVGSTTYGKATAQNLFPLDARHPNATVSDDLKPGIGYASVTIERIYRITGKTAQAQGVKPHIMLPDIYDSLEFRENVMPLAFPYDSIFKKIYYQPLMLLPTSELRHKSEQRVSVHEGFNIIKQASQLLTASQVDDQPVSLLWSEYKISADQHGDVLEQIKKAQTKVAPFVIQHHNFEMQHMQLDPSIEAFNKAWEKKLEKDISLEEAFHIICDYIDITLRKSK